MLRSLVGSEMCIRDSIETDRTVTKKSNKGKVAGIIIGVIAVIIIGGGAAYMSTDPDLFSSNVEIDERMTCESSTVLVSSTKVPNFPAPDKDLKYYQDRYNNEPKYKEWFDKNFPGQTIEDVLIPPVVEKETIIPGFPDPENAITSNTSIIPVTVPIKPSKGQRATIVFMIMRY